MEMTKQFHGRSDSAAPSDIGAAEEGTRAIYAAAALSLVAALIHLWAAPEHFEEWWGYGAFFLISALTQGLLAVLVLRRPGSNLISLCGIAGSLAIVLIYIVTRTVGIPFFGPHAGEVEGPGLLGMFSVVAEMGLAIVLITFLGDRLRTIVIGAMLALGAGIWALRLLGLLT